MHLCPHQLVQSVVFNCWSSSVHIRRGAIIIKSKSVVLLICRSRLRALLLNVLMVLDWSLPYALSTLCLVRSIISTTTKSSFYTSSSYSSRFSLVVYFGGDLFSLIISLARLLHHIISLAPLHLHFRQLVSGGKTRQRLMTWSAALLHPTLLRAMCTTGHRPLDWHNLCPQSWTKK